MKKFVKEFKEFISKGNVIDLAVGVIIGGAFGAITNSLVNDIIMPLVGMLIGIDFSSWAITLPHLFGQGEPSVIKAGAFVNTVIEFLILAFAIFCMVKVIAKFRKKKEEAPAEPSKQEVLLTEIRDILKDK